MDLRGFWCGIERCVEVRDFGVERRDFGVELRGCWC